MKKILKSQQGIAILMVMTAIVILIGIWSEFTFESKISRIKATNLLDKSQSKLMAESGLQLAMVRLRLYKEAYNFVLTNPNAKNNIQLQLLNQIWEIPFKFPIPENKDMNASLKSMLENFKKDSLLEGEFTVTIENISSRLNLNLLRVSLLEKALTVNTNPGSPPDQNPPEQMTAMQSVEQQLFNHINRIIQEKTQKDELDEKYTGLDVPELINHIRHYVSDPQSYDTPFLQESIQKFSEIKMEPKFGPFSSISEIYQVPGMDDFIVDLIKNEFSVYPVTQIDLNKITSNMLRILLPNISEDEIKEFFTIRDNPNLPVFINSLEDFKNIVVTRMNIISGSEFTTRFDDLKKQGMDFGPSPTLFKITSMGTMNRASYNIVAYVSVPTKQTTPTATPPSTPKPQGEASETENPTTQPGTAKPAQQAQLLDPRIIEIQIN
jgi:type II secretory pathway component PulK